MSSSKTVELLLGQETLFNIICMCTHVIVLVNFQADGILLHLSGELHFLNNSGGENSALHMHSFSQVVLSRGLYINFEGNSGRSVNVSTCMHIRCFYTGFYS